MASAPREPGSRPRRLSLLPRAPAAIVAVDGPLHPCAAAPSIFKAERHGALAMQPQPTDPRCELARRGDRTALDALFAQSAPRLLRMVELRMDSGARGRFGPEDVVQEALLEATRRIAEWRAQERYSLHLWLRLLTAQTLVQFSRRHLGAEKRAVARERVASAVRADARSMSDWLVATDTSPSQALGRAEIRERVLAALELLDELDREVLALRHFEQLSNEDAALELGITPAAASKRFRRALARLRPALAQISPMSEHRRP